MAIADFVIFASILTPKTQNFNFSLTNDHKYPNVGYIKKQYILQKCRQATRMQDVKAFIFIFDCTTVIKSDKGDDVTFKSIFLPFLIVIRKLK